ncbi:PapD-like protein [Mycena galopus ATCC 62051]|nr:PapD-like protein [Mycena galopus ATCC 62051]
MSVSLAPSNALGFNRPLTTLVKRSLTITNHNVQPVAFKVKTTAPRLYTVRPNSGRVEPGQSVDVLVMSQPLKDEPPLNAKCKDKFLIQSTLITPGKEAMSLTDIWASPEMGEEGKVHQQKLRVVYLPAEGQTLVEEDEEAPMNMSPMMGTGDLNHHETVRQHPSANGETAPDPAPSAPRPSTPPASFDAPGVVITPPQASVPEREPEPAPPAPPAPAPMSAAIPVAAAVSAPAPAAAIVRTPSIPTPASLPSPLPPADDYAAKYTDAQAEIERLRKLLAESQPPAELRRRTRKLSDTTAVDVAVLEEAAIQEGVPLQVVVIIALGVFITTYLFF